MGGSSGGVGEKKKQCSPKDFVTFYLSKNYQQLDKMDTSKLALRVNFLPKDQYIDQKNVSSRQYVFAFSATKFAKYIEDKGDCTVEDVFKYAGWTDSEIAAKKADGQKALAVVWQSDEPLDASSAATWDRVFSVCLPTASKLAHELKENRDTANLWSANADRNNLFVNEVTSIRTSIQQIASKGWSKNEKLTVEDYFLSKSPAEKTKVARQVMRNLLYLEELFNGDGVTTGGAHEYLIKNPYSDKLNRFYKFGELDPRVGFFSIRWADKLEGGKAKK